MVKKLSILILILSIILDQITKYYILSFVPINASFNILPILNIVLYFNYGTSFGLLIPETVWEIYAIVGISILCIAFVTYMFFKVKTLSEHLLISLILGGAISNIIDRFLHGAVIDFIDIFYKNWHWPAFNLADSFICVGAIGLMFFNIKNK